MSSDGPVIDELRRRAMEISKLFDHALRKYGEHLRKIEQQHHDRVVDQITVVKAIGSRGPRH